MFTLRLLSPLSLFLIHSSSPSFFLVPSFLYNFHPFHPICLLRLPFFFSSSHLLSPCRYFFSTLFSSLIFISLLLFPSSLLLGDLPVLEFFLNTFVPSSDVLPSSLSLLLLSFLTFLDFVIPSLSYPLPSAYHLSLTRRSLR
jgi:hypothetical protein